MEGKTHDLEKIIQGEIVADASLLIPYSTDASIFSLTPSLVVKPRNTTDLKELVQYAKEHNVSLTPRSGGTGMDGGALSESIVLDFTRYFNRIGEVSDHTLTVEPGVYYRNFEKVTRKKKLILPSYPASREICTVGGMVANNSGGELTLKYGKTEDYIEKLKVVLSDGKEYEFKALTLSELESKKAQHNFEGEIYKKMHELVLKNKYLLDQAKPKVHKNSAGYYLWNVLDNEKGIFDLTKLFVGSQGTLGLISEITFRLVPIEKKSRMVVFFLDDLSHIGEIANEILSLSPTTFESYDDKTLRLAVKFFKEFIKKLGFRNVLSIFYHALPEFFSILLRGYPKLVLQLTFTGDDEKVLEEKAKEALAVVKPFKPRHCEIIRSRIETDEYWMIRRESFNLLRHKVKDMKAAPFIDDISVKPDVLSEFLPKLAEILKPYEGKMIYNIAGHIGDGNFHIIPLMDLSKTEVRAAIPEISEKVYDLVISYRGSITGEHNDGIIRTPYLEKQFGKEVVKLFEETKKIFDPHNIFNPGKKVHGTLAFLTSRIKKTN